MTTEQLVGVTQDDDSWGAAVFFFLQPPSSNSPVAHGLLYISCVEVWTIQKFLEIVQISPAGRAQLQLPAPSSWGLIWPYCRLVVLMRTLQVSSTASEDEKK